MLHFRFKCADSQHNATYTVDKEIILFKGNSFFVHYPYIVFASLQVMALETRIGIELRFENGTNIDPNLRGKYFYS